MFYQPAISIVNQNIFQFKQFAVDQTGCAMKINTDGVLLGAMAAADDPKAILDIGTGTGVIALMLAQQYTKAKIDAVEIDGAAAGTAQRNFQASPFADRLTAYALDFESYFVRYPLRKYDLIVSNPPFYIDSLKSPGEKTTLAKHTDVDFFERLVKSVSVHLTEQGSFWLILPVTTAKMVGEIAAGFDIFPARIVEVRSYSHSRPHRIVQSFGFNKVQAQMSNLAIYEAEGVYSEEYKKLLQPFFLTF